MSEANKQSSAENDETVNELDADAPEDVEDSVQPLKETYVLNDSFQVNGNISVINQMYEQNL